MNIDNRRLRYVQRLIRAYYERLDQAKTENEKQIYQGKIQALEREEKEILLRYDVIT